MPLRAVERRVLALFLAALVLVLGYFVLLHWWFVAPQMDMDAQIRQLRAAEHRYAAVIGEKRELRQRLARLRRGQDNGGALLPESDPSTAAADLMQHVVDVAARHQAQGPCTVIQKMPVQGADKQGPYRKVSVNINLNCGTRPLAAVLYDLEQGTPYLFVDSFSAYRNPVPAANGIMQPLQVQLTLSGYLRQASTGKGGAP